MAEQMVQEEILDVTVKDVDGRVIGLAKVKVTVAIESFKILTPQDIEDPEQLELPEVKYSDTVRRYFEDKKEN